MTMDVRAAPGFALSLNVGRLGLARIDVGTVLAVLSMAGLIFSPVLGTIGVLAFLANGCLLILLRPAEITRKAIGNWPLSLLVLFCVLSLIWSREPVLSLRHGVQLAATLAIALAITDRLSPRAFCLTLSALLGTGMVASVLFGDTSGESAAWTGIYGSKNAFAGAAATFVVFTSGLAVTRSGSPLLRASALLAAIGGIGLVLLAQSIGALVLLAASLAAASILLTLPRLGRVGGLALFASGVLFALFLSLIATAHLPALSEYLLQTTGKDLTLTGRTELWAVAYSLISERPLFGVGYQAFWVHGNAEAEALWSLFGIDSRSGFNFHNMYLSNAVEIGLFGIALQTMVLFGTVWLTLQWTLRTGSAIPAIFFALTFTVLLGSLIEVPVFTQFGLKTVLIFAAYAYAGNAAARGA